MIYNNASLIKLFLYFFHHFFFLLVYLWKLEMKWPFSCTKWNLKKKKKQIFQKCIPQMSCSNSHSRKNSLWLVITCVNVRWGDNSLFSFSKCSFNCNCHLLHSTFDLCYVNYKNKTFSLHLPHITSVSMCISVTQGKRSIFSWKCQMKKHFRIRSYPIDLYRLFSQISCVKFKSSAHFICIVFFSSFRWKCIQ